MTSIQRVAPPGSGGIGLVIGAPEYVKGAGALTTATAYNPNSGESASTSPCLVWVYFYLEKVAAKAVKIAGVKVEGKNFLPAGGIEAVTNTTAVTTIILGPFIVPTGKTFTPEWTALGISEVKAAYQPI